MADTLAANRQNAQQLPRGGCNANPMRPQYFVQRWLEGAAPTCCRQLAESAHSTPYLAWGARPPRLHPSAPRRYVFRAPITMAARARDLSRRNTSTAQARSQHPKASFAHQHPCGLKSALRRSRGVRARHITRLSNRVFGEGAEHCTRGACAPLAENIRSHHNVKQITMRPLDPTESHAGCRVESIPHFINPTTGY